MLVNFFIVGPRGHKSTLRIIRSGSQFKTPPRAQRESGIFKFTVNLRKTGA